jgi:hypothetical protein
MISGGKTYRTIFSTCLKLILIIILGFTTLLVQACVTKPVNTKFIDPRTTLANPIIWLEQDDFFTTNDAARAQAEIPFSLRLPTFFPSGENVSLPQIIGPLAQKSTSDKIDVKIQYFLRPSKGAIQIEEYNHPILPPGPKDIPDYKLMEIEGKEVVTTEGNFFGGEGLVYYFNINGIYFVVIIENLASEDKISIVKSIINQ